MKGRFDVGGDELDGVGKAGQKRAGEGLRLEVVEVDLEEAEVLERKKPCEDEHSPPQVVDLGTEALGRSAAGSFETGRWKAHHARPRRRRRAWAAFQTAELWIAAT